MSASPCWLEPRAAGYRAIPRQEDKCTGDIMRMTTTMGVFPTEVPCCCVIVRGLVKHIGGGIKKERRFDNAVIFYCRRR